MPPRQNVTFTIPSTNNKRKVLVCIWIEDSKSTGITGSEGIHAGGSENHRTPQDAPQDLPFCELHCSPIPRDVMS